LAERVHRSIIIENKVNYPLVGAFVLILGAALVAGLLWLASGGALRKKYDAYLAIEDESVAGLNLNAPVKYNGVTVGKVRDIRLDPVNPQRVRLIFAIEHGTPIKQDTFAVLKIQGLTGIAYVELAGGTREAPPLLASAAGEMPMIRTKPSLSTRLENVLTTVMEKLDSTTRNVNALLSSDNRQAVSSVLADLAKVSHMLAERRDTMDSGIASAARTFEHTAQVSAQLGPTIERLDRAARAVEKLGTEGAQASATAGKTAESLGADLKQFSTQTLPELQNLLGELTALSASLRRVSEQTERNPSGLLFGHSPVPEGPGETTTGRKQP